MAGLRESLNGPAGKGIAIGVVVIGLIVGFISLRRNLGPGEAAYLSTDRVFIDTENGKTFTYSLKVGDMIPIKSPYSGKNTGVEAERCFWTKDGKAKKDPTYVLLNSRKGAKEPTFCPDCGRLVVGLNPSPVVGIPPPPTKEEWEKQPKGKRPAQGQD
jgi:hypothetical protein